MHLKEVNPLLGVILSRGFRDAVYSEGLIVAHRPVSLLKRSRLLTFDLSLDGRATSLPFGWVTIKVSNATQLATAPCDMSKTAVKAQWGSRVRTQL